MKETSDDRSRERLPDATASSCFSIASSKHLWSVVPLVLLAILSLWTSSKGTTRDITPRFDLSALEFAPNASATIHHESTMAAGVAEPGGDNNGVPSSLPANPSKNAYMNMRSEPIEVSSKRLVYTSQARYPHAYAFVIWKVDPSDPAKPYRKYLSNIFVAAKLLREWEIQADIMLLLKLRSGTTHLRLPDEDLENLDKLGIRLVYLPQPPDIPDPDKVFRQMFFKFALWNCTDYERILYLDSDVLPLANLDYMFHLSYRPKEDGDKHRSYMKGYNVTSTQASFWIQPNAVIAGWAQPANGGFVLLEPNTEDYYQLQDLIATKQGTRARPFDVLNGWGHTIQPPDLWETNFEKQGTNWTFYAAGFDQGLFYHYPKYVKRKLTQILSRKIVNYAPSSKDPTEVVVEAEWPITSSKDSPFAPFSQRRMKFRPGNCHRMTGRSKQPWPGCLPPYSDWSHFTGKAKPLTMEVPESFWKAPSSFSKASRGSATSDVELWWRTFRDLHLEDGIDVTELGVPSLGPDAKERLDQLNITNNADSTR